MTLRVRIGGVWKTVSKMWIRKSGVWKEVERASIYKTHGDPETVGWREFFKKGGATPPPLPPGTPPPPNPQPIVFTGKIVPAQVSGTRTTPGFVSTNTTTVTPTNGTAPFTYQWTRMSWDTNSPPTISAPNSATTSFGANVNNYDDSRSANFKCIVKDATGKSFTKQCSASFNVTHPAGAPAP